LNVEVNAVPLTDEGWVARMNPLSVDQVSLDGVVYGLTIWDTLGGTWVIVYNKDIFAEFNLNIPTTYAEFSTLNQTLMEAGINPIYEPIADGWHHVLWFPEIGPAYEAASPGLTESLNANETTFSDNPTMLQALTQIQEIFEMGFFGEDALSNEFVNTEAAMASGEYAMTVNRFGLPEQIQPAYPDVSADKFGFFLIPLVDNQIWNVNPAGPSKFIYSGSNYIEAAKAYFEFLTRPENLQYLLDNEPQFALLNFDGVTYELTADQQAFVDTYSEQGTVLQTAVTYVNPQWMDIGQDLVAMFTGAMSPEEVLSSIDARRTDMATTAGDPAWD
jgi:raffinose/stachyose/melibiose transport system substrate-binding protein